MKDVICPGCGKAVPVKDAMASLETDDRVLLEYTIKSCFCHDCKLPLYSKEVEDFNRAASGEAMRKVIPGMLSLKTIRGLPRRYDISRSDFKKVMGIAKEVKIDEYEWVAHRIFDGELPTESEEERLQLIDKDPKVYIEFLKLAKDVISAEAYERSMQKALELVDKK